MENDYLMEDVDKIIIHSNGKEITIPVSGNCVTLTLKTETYESCRSLGGITYQIPISRTATIEFIPGGEISLIDPNDPPIFNQKICPRTVTELLDVILKLQEEEHERYKRDGR